MLFKCHIAQATPASSFSTKTILDSNLAKFSTAKILCYTMSSSARALRRQLMISYNFDYDYEYLLAERYEA